MNVDNCDVEKLQDNVECSIPVDNPLEAAVQVAEADETTGETESVQRENVITNEAAEEVSLAGSQSIDTEEVTGKNTRNVVKLEDLPANFDAVIDATVFIENSPNSRIEKNIYKSIFNIIDSKDHIRRNVGRVKVENVKNIVHGDSRYRHEATFIFFVDSSRLWESPHSYLWKHFGNAEWTLPDDSKLSFVKMHKK